MRNIVVYGLQKMEESLRAVGELAGPGIIHQPAISCDGSGAVWAVWAEVIEKSNTWRLLARRVVDGKIAAEAEISATIVDV